MITPQKILIWLARLISSVAVIFFLVFVIGEGIGELTQEKVQFRIEGIILLVLLLFAAVATIVAWKKEKLGSLLLFIAGIFLIVFVVLTAKRNQGLVSLIMGGPFILSAILLFLFRKDRKKRKELLVVDNQ